MSTVDETLSARGSRYGDFKDVARLTQAMLYPVAKVINGRDGVHTYHVEAIHMIIQKIARAVCGDPMYADNWHDIQGYAKLVEDEINKVPAVHD